MLWIPYREMALPNGNHSCTSSTDSRLLNVIVPFCSELVRLLCPVPVSSMRPEHTGKSLAKGHKDDEGRTCEDRLSQLRLPTEGWGNLINICKYSKGRCKDCGSRLFLIVSSEEQRKKILQRPLILTQLWSITHTKEYFEVNLYSLFHTICQYQFHQPGFDWHFSCTKIYALWEVTAFCAGI